MSAEWQPQVIHLPQWKGGDGPSANNIRWIALVLIIAALALSSFYTVNPEQVGVVQRFGRYIGKTPPGLHFKIPFVDTITKVPVQRQLKQEFGFRTVSAGVQSQFTSQGYEDESTMLTGDLNVASVEWVVQYRIADPYKYLFRVRNVDATLRDMSEAVMRSVVGDRTVNEVLTVGRADVSDRAKVKLQKLCDEYETGVRIDQVVLQDVNPPEPVKPSFNEVNEAQQEREKLINQAQSQYNKVIPRAKGDAKKTIEEAKGYAIDRVNRAEGEATRFNDLYAQYKKAPEVTRKRIYLETLNQILPEVGRKVVVDGKLKSVLPLLNLESMPTGGGKKQASDGGGR
ncbi:MAG TPA: FtsH protease activity modulator HflK [Thermoanaerobaculia bacterium]|nr:FtsH protease activity modulator HflK [Thermoanaerobaculia bacterium]